MVDIGRSRTIRIPPCRAGPFLEDNGESVFIIFIEYTCTPVPISPSLANPDETQSWVAVDYEDTWFTWVPIRLLSTMESSKEQVAKMFRFMTDCPAVSRLAKLEDRITDVFAANMHYVAHRQIIGNNRPVVHRLQIFFRRDTPSTRPISNHTNFVNEIRYAVPPATKQFLELKILRFEIEVDEGGDHNGPCSICLEDFKVKCGELLAKMPCRHVFHNTCIIKWLKTSGTCPLCKFKAECQTSDNVDDVSENYDISDWFENIGNVFVIRD